jgi:hypothetical protein
MTKPKAITGYSKLVEQAAEKYGQLYANFPEQALRLAAQYKCYLEDPITGQLIEQIAREAYLAGIKAFEDYEYREMGYPIFDNYWAKFMEVQGE